MLTLVGDPAATVAVGSQGLHAGDLQLPRGHAWTGDDRSTARWARPSIRRCWAGTIHVWLRFVRCSVGSVLVSDSSVASATHVSDPIEECSTSTVLFSPSPRTPMPTPA
jgi:hypothetical protein